MKFGIPEVDDRAAGDYGDLSGFPKWLTSPGLNSGCILTRSPSPSQLQWTLPLKSAGQWQSPSTVLRHRVGSPGLFRNVDGHGVTVVATAKMSSWGDLTCLCSRNSEKRQNRSSEQVESQGLVRRGAHPVTMEPKPASVGRVERMNHDRAPTGRQDTLRPVIGVVPSREYENQSHIYYTAIPSPSLSATSCTTTNALLEDSLPTARKSTNMQGEESVALTTVKDITVQAGSAPEPAADGTIRFAV